MGCDIHTYCERKNAKGEWEYVAGVTPFDWRSYGVFGWLAGVRNYSAITPISDQRGMPEDVSEDVLGEYERWGDDAHSASWLSLNELLSVDYSKEIEDRRYSDRIGENAWSGGLTADPGEGIKMTLREFLHEGYFEDLDQMREMGVDRVVFWFDS